MALFGTPTYDGIGAGTSLAPARPADLVDNGWVMLGARSQDGTGTTQWTPPAGFQPVTVTPTLPNNANRVAQVWVKQIGAVSAEPATYVVSGPSGRAVAFAVRYNPEELGTLAVVGTTQYGGNSANAGIVMFNAHTLSGAPALTIVMLAAECTAGISHVPSTIPAGCTTIANAQNTLNEVTTGSRTALWIGYRVESSTDFAALSGGFAGASASGGYSATIRGGKVAPPAPIGVPVKLGDGTLGYVSYIDGDGVRRAPASVRFTRPAFTLAQSLSTPGVTMGHRGASAVAGQPEMSRRAYRYAATARDYRMLEFSCNRTSDGVFVGCHDADINRVAMETGLPNLSAMTWAQVQTHVNALNAAGLPAPFYRLDAFLDEFAGEALVHVDPKYNTGGTAAFLNVLDAHGGPSRIVVKYVGTGSGAMAIADAAKARDYMTACYFYEADWAAGKIDAEQSHWDILGMEYTASTDAWSRTTTGTFPGIRSYGKPVLAHIIPSIAGYNLAKGKIEEGGWVNPGAGRSWIAQISRPDLVTPVR
ncbi:hypothetical protein CQ047_17765 [Microbacterium sp. MYb72]|uniref:glycerophosphodiester phosphodiesterase n=1 Tax=Microbacterium sp. MYb72 TaxID=1848693 RepID=UPI000CFCEC82|nr:glycerophosphodiester phosphodiesterase family protein [Microbacterium sp. MYb72]PRB02752.1 hypothetical protein CQ047_17765 [Microbacterium sp. MYb72]